MKKLILEKVLDSQGRRKKWLADELGVSSQTIWNWCRGDHNTTYDKVIQMAEVLGIAPEELYEDEPIDNEGIE